MSEQEFFLHELFREKHKVTLTIEEIAKHYDISIEKAKENLKGDINAGLVIEHQTYSSYYLTFEGLRALCKK